MKKQIRNIIFILGLISTVFVSCEDKIDPLVEELELSRVLSPINIQARIRNMTTVELSWDLWDNADAYVVEISEDNFASIVKTVTVAPNEIPVSIQLDGETLYYGRVKAVSNSGIADSKWVTGTFMTDAENIFYAIDGEDIKATRVTLKWPAGSEVTSFLINPGNIERAITADEIAAGQATITGLTGETEYTVTMRKGTKQRGLATFTTLVDIGDATAVYPEDDLSAMIAAAADGDALVLFPGDYLVYTGSITINKSVSIKGYLPYNKPIIHVQFVLEDGVQAVEVRDVEMDGNVINAETSLPALLDYGFQFNTSGTSYGTLNIVGCTIHDYNKSLFSGSSSIASTIESITIDNCVVTDILTNSADFMDIRGGHLASLSVTNSTFNNCAPGRDFIRLDDTSGTFPGRVTAVVVNHCTLYGVSNTSDRILYVRFVDNTLNVSNTIIAETSAYFTNQSRSSQPECSHNNYYNAPGFIPGGTSTSGAKFDISGNYTELNPGFADAANGNFTISNQSLIDDKIGDPRWINQ